MVLRKKKQQPKAEPKKAEVTKVEVSPEEALILQAAKDEAAVAKKNVNKKPLTDRQKFHKFYQEEYLQNIDYDAPHHPDKHGVLGCETNIVTKEVRSQEFGKYIVQDVNGMCGYCSLSQKSARQAYGD